MMIYKRQNLIFTPPFLYIIVTVLTCFIVSHVCVERVERNSTGISIEKVLDYGGEEENEDSEGEPEDSNEENKFKWSNHHTDHGIYSHRSLISEKAIKPIDLEESEQQTLRKKDYVEKEWQLMFRAFDTMADSGSSSILLEIAKNSNIFEEISSRLSPACQRDLNHLKLSMKKHKLWALRMMDSYGKLPSGITYGRFSSPGDYEECLSIQVDEDVYVTNTKNKTAKTFKNSNSRSDTERTIEHYKFDGKYCLLDFRLPLPERPKNKLLSVYESVLDLSQTEIIKKFPEVQNYSAYASIFYEVGYMHAVCIPSSCDELELSKSVGQALEGMYVIVNSTIDCQIRSDHNGGTPLRTSQVISLTLLTLLFINATLATILYHYQTERTGGNPVHGENKVRRIVSRLGFTNTKFYSECFAIQSNFARLSKPDPRGLTFVHYTRIVAMALTVITHTGAMGTLQAITKPADASSSDAIFRDFLPQMLANAFTSIQIFFYMAGFMLVISTYPSIKRERGHLSFVEYAIKRAIRLMPGLAATIAINFIWPLVVDGPMLNYFIRMIVEPCEKNWYRTLGFLSNFDHVEKMCLRHSYFSASDYQLHILAFPLLILLYKKPLVALGVATILTLAGFVAQVIMTLTKTVMPFILIDYLDKEAFFNVVHYMHHPVWNHMSAFFYGFIIGYLVVRKVRINLSPTTIKRIWWILMPLGICSIFAPYFWNHYKRPIERWHMVLYVIFDRFILLTTCAWLSYATMVLGRVKKERKPDAIAEDGKRKNFAEVVTIPPNQESPADIKNQLGTPTSKLNKIKSTSDICALVDQLHDNQKLRNSLSSNDLKGTAGLIGKEENNLELQTKPPETNNRKQQNVSNVNILCLILSRLTFQLYLFNMVVLWVDVNHSKYFFFFSYYFIIVKASAVYICSTIMAMIFFVTLESPCLSLYIAWVRSRAKARGDKKQRQEEEEQERKREKLDEGSRLGIRSPTPDVGLTDKTPTFTYIDLSSPNDNRSDSSGLRNIEEIESKQQTKM